MKVTLATLLSLLVLAPAASAADTDVVAAMGTALERVADRTTVPVRVPETLPLDFDGEIYADGTGSRKAWEISLAGAPDCGNATACFLAMFSGERGGTPAFKRTVKLVRGITGYFKPLSCGASCSPPMIQWKQSGVLFTIQAKVAADRGKAERTALVRAANSAIRSEPR